jgi:hypothetical protein
MQHGSWVLQDRPGRGHGSIGYRIAPLTPPLARLVTDTGQMSRASRESHVSLRPRTVRPPACPVVPQEQLVPAAPRLAVSTVRRLTTTTRGPVALHPSPREVDPEFPETCSQSSRAVTRVSASTHPLHPGVGGVTIVGSSRLPSIRSRLGITRHPCAPDCTNHNATAV